MLLQNVRKHLGYFILRGIEGLRSLHACIGIGIQMDTNKQIRLILIDQLDALFHILTLAIGSTLACQIIGSISSHGHMCTSILQQLFQLLCYLQIDFLFLCLVAAGTIILPTMTGIQYDFHTIQCMKGPFCGNRGNMRQTEGRCQYGTQQPCTQQVFFSFHHLHLFKYM